MRISEVILVGGYGCNLDSPLRPHLDRLIGDVERTGTSHIMFSGGRTQNKSFPGLFEAQVMADYVCERVSHELTVVIDTNPYTSFESVRNAARNIRMFGWEPDQITIYCEATRALGMALLARHFVGFPPAQGKSPIRIRTTSWELAHPAKQLRTVIEYWLCCRVPGLWRYFRWQRIKRAEWN